MADWSDTNRMQAPMAHLLGEASRNLACFLEKVLPGLFDNWWNEAGVRMMSEQSLAQGCLAALSRSRKCYGGKLPCCFDKLWYQIAINHNESQSNGQLGYFKLFF